MSDYGPGDRVRVTYEGVVDTKGKVVLDNARWLSLTGGLKPEIVEVLPRPFQPGDTVRVLGNDPSHYLDKGTLGVIEAKHGAYWSVVGYSTRFGEILSQIVQPDDLEPFSVDKP